MENEDKSAGITLKQVNFIKQLVKRKEGRVEPNYDEMSMNEAKKLISDWLEENGQKPKTMGDVQSGDKEAIDLLRQILAELKGNKVNL